MAATSDCDLHDGPVLSLINKRLRALRKKLNRIAQMEEAVAQGKPINKEQEDVLRSKPSVSAAIDELDKLRDPLSAAVSEEKSIAIQTYKASSSAAESTVSAVDVDNDDDNIMKESNKYDSGNDKSDDREAVVEDLLNLLYYGTVFDVKSQSEFTSTMLTRRLERECCLSYDYVTDDDAADPLGERDLDLISAVGGLLITRPVDSSLSHRNALQRCVEHAKLWLAKSDQPIHPDSPVTLSYAGLREKLTKIMASHYSTTVPQLKAPVEVATEAGDYASFQVPVQVESSVVQFTPEGNDAEYFQGDQCYANQSSPAEEPHQGELEVENSSEVSAQTEPIKTEVQERNSRDGDLTEQQYQHRRSYQNQRGCRTGGGRRGYSNGRGGRGSGQGGYQNGRSQYYDQGGNYNPRNYNNNRGRGDRGGGGNYNNHGSAAHAGNALVDS